MGTTKDTFSAFRYRLIWYFYVFISQRVQQYHRKFKVPFFGSTPNFKLPMLGLFPPPISWKYDIFFTKIWIFEVVMHSAYTALMCQYFALLLFQLMPNLNKSAVILWKCNNPLFAWITLAESKRKKLFGATMELINDALERRCFGSSIMLKWCKGFSIQLTLSRVHTMGLEFFLKLH